MKKIEITPANIILIFIVNEIIDFGIENITLTPIMNMEHEHMMPRYGDWDVPPSNDYRTKIEVIVLDNQVDQVVGIIQNIFNRTNFKPPRQYGNEIFVSNIENTFCIQNS